jgi:CheY-like chemotaxis protein
MRWTGTRVRHRLGRLAGRRPGPAAARVLVVDDDEVIRQLIAVHLRVGGLAADLAADGPAGLDRARCGRPDVVILDAGMPGLDGWAVAARLRADPATASIRIIMLVPGPGGALGVPGPGGPPGVPGPGGTPGVPVHACLAKPFDPAELMATVRRLARGQDRPRASRWRQRPGGAAGVTPE